MYKCIIDLDTNAISLKFVLKVKDNATIPFDPANTDYQNVKAEILNDEATLQDADGVEMTPDAAKEFIRTLP